MAASLITPSMSAPEKSFVSARNFSSSIFSILFPRLTFLKMSNLSSSPGSFISRILSNLPGLNSAGSSTSTLLVAPKMYTPPLSSNPSIMVSIWLTALLCVSVLLPQKESISSKKTKQGCKFFALSKVCLIAFSVSPTYFVTNSGPRTEIKFKLRFSEIVLANKVFPVPGGPCKSIPVGFLTPKLAKSSGYCAGIRTK